MFWGFSEAIDFHNEYKCHNGQNKSKSVLNILLFGSSDSRHIIKTLAKSYLHCVSIHFYVIEGCPALLARHMLLTAIPLEPPSLLSLVAKIHLFMDIYANTRLRASSALYVISKGKHFTNCITDTEFNEQMQPIFDFTNLKYIERDCLEQIFNFWRGKTASQFDLNRLWKQRVQQRLGFRYDSRMGAFDWDLNMRLKDYGAQQICAQEYKHWRETGVAFTFPEYRQNCTNKTFAIQKPDKEHGNKFIGDVTVGPFSAFGLSCSDPEMLKSNHGQNQFRATDVSERNICELFFEIDERRVFQPELFKEHRLGGAILDLGKNMEQDSNELSVEAAKDFNEPLKATEQIRVRYLSAGDFQSIISGKKFDGFFDGVFVGREYFKIINKDFAKVFAAEAVILFETLQLSTHRKGEIGEFLKGIRNMAKEMELKPITNFNINLPVPIAKFQKTFEE